MAEKRAHLYVSGRVQGVNFRYYTRQQAASQGVKGWVRNLRDGRVEAVFEGPGEAVERMVDWCEKGPPAARVTDLEVNWEEPEGSFTGFHVRY
jgi:acylphosphatase